MKSVRGARPGDLKTKIQQLFAFLNAISSRKKNTRAWKKFTRSRKGVPFARLETFLWTHKLTIKYFQSLFSKKKKKN